MIKKSFKKSLLTGASAFVVGTMASSMANATALSDANLTANDGFTLGAAALTISNGNTVKHDTAATADLVQVSGTSGNLTVAGTVQGIGDSTATEDTIGTTGANTDWLLNVSSGGVITHDGTAGQTIHIEHNIGTITNLGKIETTGGNALVINVDANAVIVNGDGTTAATITANGTGTAIDLAAGTSSLTNKAAALITSSGDSANGVIDVTGDLTGTITNAGSITTSGAGIGIDLGGGVSGGVTNSGLIQTATGTALNISSNETTDITNTGTIESTGDGLAVDIGATLTGTFTNNGGEISGSGAGDSIIHSRTGGITGKFINSNGGTITGDAVGSTIEIDADFTLGLENTASTISTTGNGAAAIAVDVDADMAVGITNTGTISSSGADGNAIDFGADAALTNSGTISSADDSTIAITAENTKTITNSATGVIKSVGNAAGTEAAIFLRNTLGGITNTGTIQDTTTGVAIDFNNNNITAGITNNSAGVITSATGIAIDFDNNGTGGIDNDGTISVTGTAATTNAINITDASTGTIDNSGTISNAGTGAASAIDIGNAVLTGTITNSGLITAAGTDATIEASNANADIDTGSLVNSGTISNTSSGEAINLATSTDAGVITITNSGTISSTSGTVITLGTEDILTQTAGAITAANATTAAISDSAGANVLNWHGGTITGTIDLGADNGDTINVGNASTDSISTGGAISNIDILNVDQGTFNIGHAITLATNTETFNIDSGATAKVTASVSVDAENININGGLNVANGVDLTLSSTSGTNEYATGNGSTITSGISTNSDFGQIVATAGTSDFNIVTGTNLVFDVTNGSEAILAGELVDVISSDDIQVDGTTATATTLASALNVSDDSYVLSFAVSTNSNGTGLDVTVTRANAYQTASSKVNESAVGTALEAIGNDGDSGLDAINGTLDSFTTAAQVEAALETLNPDMSGAINAAAVGAAEAGLGVVGNRLDQLAGISGTGVAAGGMSYNHGIWGEVFGTAADQNDRDGVKGYQADTVGFGIGGDTAISEETKIGASFAYASTEADSANGESEIDSYQFSLYGTRDYGKWFADALAGITFNSFDVKRNIVVGTISNQAKADFDGHQYSLKVGGGYKLDVEGGLNVTPVASLKYDYLRLDDYTETGSTANLTVDNDDIHMLKTDLGVKLNYPIVDGSMTYIPEISTSWSYDLIGDEQEAKNNFVGAASTQFTTKGADVAQHQFNVGLGLDVLAQDNVTVSFDYDWASKEDYNSHSGAVKARFAF